MRKEYTKPTVSIIEVDGSGKILADSVTCHKIEISEVEVEEFEDGGVIDISFD